MSRLRVRAEPAQYGEQRVGLPQLAEDGRRAGGIYVWESRAAADRLYTAAWSKFVEGKYGTPPQIEYLHSPVMVDNREGTISVAAAGSRRGSGSIPHRSSPIEHCDLGTGPTM